MKAGGSRRRGASTLVAVALTVAVLLSGCSSARCTPAVEVSNCGTEPCSAGERRVDWDAEAGALWPPVADLIDGTPAGKTGRASWTADQQEAFWAFWDVPADRRDKQVFFLHEGATFRVADQPCEG